MGLSEILNSIIDKVNLKQTKSFTSSAGIQATSVTGALDELKVSTLGGTSQSYQNVYSSRASGVTYTNTTGKPIFVIASGGVASSATNRSIELYCNDIIISSSVIYTTSGPRLGVCAIIPNNSTYKVVLQNGLAVSYWYELR